MKVDKRLVEFIKEAKRRGYSNDEIASPLLQKGWTIQEIDLAAKESTKENKVKEKVVKSGAKEEIKIYLDKSVLEAIRKRAKRNMLSVPEQIEDIVRRSCINAKLKTPKQEKLDDLLVGIFSRRKQGMKK